MLKNNRGQVMLLAVSLIGFSVLAATAIAGYLSLQKIRMTTNIIDSTKAIYAADSGIECELYNKNKAGGEDCQNFSFDDGKTKVKTIVDANSIKSIGSSNKSNRAFFVSF